MFRFSIVSTIASAVLISSFNTGCTDLSDPLDRDDSQHDQPHDQPQDFAPEQPYRAHDVPVRHWDGVAFTDIEAFAVLAYANEASLMELDDQVGLDIRAARSIVQSRPLKNMRHLSNLFFVGADALKRLKAAAPAVETVLASTRA